MKLVGRVSEMTILREALASPSSEMVAVYGRRRVGKTFLVSNVYEKNIVFSMSGLLHVRLADQLQNFAFAMRDAKKTKRELEAPVSWLHAFDELKLFLSTHKAKNKRVIFFDELPWLDTPKSNFLQALDHFWNSWAAHRQDIVLVICGSAASWMIKKILNNRGGLHNLVTRRVRLMPFTLQETELFLQSKGVRFDRYSIVQLYMAIGGIPFYLNEIKRGESVMQNISRICFAKAGLLQSEFDNLYKALFNNSDKHVLMIKALAKSHKGLSRNEIIKSTKLKTGGSISQLLNELIESGFVSEIKAQGKKSKDNIYRLTDEYSLFYIKFIEPNLPSNRSTWTAVGKTPLYVSWCGYAFENLCFKHIDSILQTLGINGIHTTVNSWQSRNTQIDLLIDRDDRCVNICEVKFCNTEFEINRSYSAALQRKIQSYRSEYGMRKSYFLTFITTFGLKENIYKNSVVDQVIILEDLFYNVL